MMKAFKKTLVGILGAMLIVGSLFVAKNELVMASSKKIIKKNITLIQGQSYRLERPDSKKMKIVNWYVCEPKKNITKISTSNKKVAVVKTKKGDTYDTVKGKKVYDRYVNIKTLKKGKTTIRFNLKLQDSGMYSYKITVNVKALKFVQTQARKALKKYEKTLKTGERYAYADLNNDKVNELIFSDKIWYYDYEKNKVKSVKHSFSDFIAGSGNTFVGVLKKPTVIKEDNRVIKTIRKIYQFDTSKIFKYVETTYSYRMYNENAMKYYGVKDPYIFHDTSYDQDDYDYQGMNCNEMKKHIKKYVKKAKSIKWLNR